MKNDGYAREQYMDSLGRLRTRRVRCNNHAKAWAVKILICELGGGTEYEPVCGPCYDVYMDYGEALATQQSASPVGGES